MKFSTGSTRGWLIGDPHFGKNFSTGMPLHRRGDREQMQRELFLAELRTPEVNMNIMVGDLFDKPIIPLPRLAQVIQDVWDAAREQPDVEFLFMAGNHDKSRQLTEMGAWEIFSMALSPLANVEIIDVPTAVRGVMLYPWEWGRTALEQVEQFGSPSCEVAVGHWDLKDFGGDASHVAPTKALRELNPNVIIYSGHYHEENDYPVAGHIDQAASNNLFIPSDADKWDLLMLHFRAWEQGIKSLYYLRSKSVQRAGFAGGVEADNTIEKPKFVAEVTNYDECLACQ